MSGVRFAPSPTGRFHLGNLRTAWLSFKIAQHLKVPWVVRFEDIDRPRVREGAQDLQLQDMARLGLKPDIILVQSSFVERHWSVFERGVHSGQIYPCDCSRKDVQTHLGEMASAPNTTVVPVYSGHCRHANTARTTGGQTIAWRFRSEREDGLEDFIVARTNPVGEHMTPDRTTFAPSYHLACAVDDYDGKYDVLVRASDLETAAHPQRELHAWLSRAELGASTLPAPIFHTALITQNDGHRLEKRTAGVTLDELRFTNGPVEIELRKIFQRSFSEADFAPLDAWTSVRGEVSPAGSVPLWRERHSQFTLAELGL